MDDAGYRLVFTDHVVHRLDGEHAVLIPVGRREGQGRDLLAPVPHLDLAVVGEVDRDIGGRCDTQPDVVGVLDRAVGDDVARGIEDVDTLQHARAAAVLEHQQRAEIVIEHRDLDVRDRSLVVDHRRGVAGRIGHDFQAVAHHHLALALDGVVVRRLDEDVLAGAGIPVRRGELDDTGIDPGRAAVDRDLGRGRVVRTAGIADVARGQALVVRRRQRHGDREEGRGKRLDAAVRAHQVHVIGIDRPVVLDHAGAAGGLLDNDLARGLARHVQRDAVDLELVVGGTGSAGRAMIDDRAHAVEARADDISGDIAADDEAVAAEAADHRGNHVVARAEDEELVVALQAVDLRGFLHPVQMDVQAGAEDAVRRDDERVAFLGADRHYRVEAETAVDADRGVDVVLELVVVAAAQRDDVGFGDEGADHEIVVAGLAFHPQHGLVAVDVEGVVAFAAERGQRVADAAAQPAAGDQRQRDVVAAGSEVDVGEIVGDHARIARARRIGVDVAVRVGAEHLADLEQVLALATVERSDGAVVVDVELIVAVTCTHGQATVDGAVVVDALDLGREGELPRGVGPGRRHECDEVLAQQERVGQRRAVDGQGVGAVVLGAGIVDVDEIARAPARDSDLVGVRATTTVEVDGVAHGLGLARRRMMIGTVVRGRDRRQPVEHERVASPCKAIDVAQDHHVTAERLRMQEEDVVAAVAGDQVGDRVERAVDIDARTGGGIGIAVVDAERDLRARLHQAARVDAHVVTGEQRGRGGGADVGARGRDEILIERGTVGGGEVGVGCAVADRQERDGRRIDGLQRDVRVGGLHILDDGHEAGRGHPDRVTREQPVGRCRSRQRRTGDAADGQAAAVVDEDATGAGRRFQPRQGGFERVARGADTGGRVQQRVRGDDLLRRERIGSVVQNRTGSRIDRHVGGGGEQAQHDIVGGIDIDQAASGIDERAVGHRDATATDTVAVGADGDRRAAALGVDRTGGAEGDVATGAESHRAAAARDRRAHCGIDRSGQQHRAGRGIDRFGDQQRPERRDVDGPRGSNADLRTEVSDLEVAAVLQPDAARRHRRLEARDAGFERIGDGADAGDRIQDRRQGVEVGEGVGLRHDEPVAAVADAAGRVDAHVAGEGPDLVDPHVARDIERDAAGGGGGLGHVEVGDAVQEDIATGTRGEIATDAHFEEIAGGTDVLAAHQQRIARGIHIRGRIDRVGEFIEDRCGSAQRHVDTGHGADAHVALVDDDGDVAAGIHARDEQVVDRARLGLCAAEQGRVGADLANEEVTGHIRDQFAGARQLQAQGIGRARRGRRIVAEHRAGANVEIAERRDRGGCIGVGVLDRPTHLQPDVATGTRADVVDVQIAAGLQRDAGPGHDLDLDRIVRGGVGVGLDVDIVDDAQRHRLQFRCVGNAVDDHVALAENVVHGRPGEQLLIRARQAREAARRDVDRDDAGNAADLIDALTGGVETLAGDELDVVRDDVGRLAAGRRNAQVAGQRGAGQQEADQRNRQRELQVARREGARVDARLALGRAQVEHERGIVGACAIPVVDRIEHRAIGGGRQVGRRGPVRELLQADIVRCRETGRRGRVGQQVHGLRDRLERDVLSVQRQLDSLVALGGRAGHHHEVLAAIGEVRDRGVAAGVDVVGARGIANDLTGLDTCRRRDYAGIEGGAGLGPARAVEEVLLGEVDHPGRRRPDEPEQPVRLLPAGQREVGDDQTARGHRRGIRPGDPRIDDPGPERRIGVGGLREVDAERHEHLVAGLEAAAGSDHQFVGAGIDRLHLQRRRGVALYVAERVPVLLIELRAADLVGPDGLVGRGQGGIAGRANLRIECRLFSGSARRERVVPGIEDRTAFGAERDLALGRDDRGRGISPGNWPRELKVVAGGGYAVVDFRHDYIALRTHGHAAVAEDIAVDAQRLGQGSDGAGHRREFDPVATDQRGIACRRDALGRIDEYVAPGRVDGSQVEIRTRIGRQRILHRVDDDVLGRVRRVATVCAGIDVQRARAIALDVDGDRIAGADSRIDPEDGSSRIGNDRSPGRGDVDGADRRTGDVPLQRNVLDAVDRDGRRRRPLQEVDDDRVVGLERVGVVVLDALNLGDRVADCLVAQPAAAFLDDVLGPGVVEERAQVVDIGGGGRRRDVLPERGVLVVLVRQPQAGRGRAADVPVAVIQHTRVEVGLPLEHRRQDIARTGGGKSDGGGVRRHLHEFVVDLDELDRVSVGRDISRGLARVRPRFGFEQRKLVVVEDVLTLPLVVRHQPVPVETEQVEALGLIDADGRLGARLAFDPDVFEALLRLVTDVRQSVGTAVVRGARKVVLHCRHHGVAAAHVLVRNDRQAVVALLGDHLVGVDRVFGLGQACGVDDGDLAVARLGGVDPVEDQLVLALVVDIDAGVAMSYLDVAVAGAEDLSCEHDPSALRHDVVDHDRLLGGVEVALDRHPVRPEGDAAAGVTVVVEETLGLRGAETRIDFQRDGLHPTLDHAVDVEVARRHRDAAL